jgi:hypothetical protein
MPFSAGRARDDVFDEVFRTLRRSSSFTSRHLVDSKLPGRYHSQRLRVSGGGDGNGQWRTLFDVDRQEKLVALVPLVALELFPSRPTRLGAFGTIQQVHLRLQVRLLGRNDQRECWWPAG